MKRKYILLIVVILVISFALPYVITKAYDDQFQILAFSFKAISAFASLTTLCIALLLYQNFNIDSIVIQKQTEKVLELVDLIKGKITYIKTDKFTYLVKFSPESSSFYETPQYLSMAGLPIITRIDDYNDYGAKLINLSNSYWLPNEIRRKMDFLKFTALTKKVSIEETSSYAKLKFKHIDEEDDEWWLVMPNLNDYSNDFDNPIKLEETSFLVNDYVTSKDSLSREISEWLKTKTSINFDLNLEMPNQMNEAENYI